MTREQLSSLLRWAAVVAGGSLLLVVLGARAPGGPQRRNPAGPAYVSAPGGASAPALAQVVADVAGPHISGPYTSTTPAFSFNGKVSQLPRVKQPAEPDRPEVDSGQSELASRPPVNDPVVQSANSSSPGGPNMPGTLSNFAGLDFNTWGAGHPPDTNGDIGPIYYVQTVNTAIGVYTKTTGLQAAALTFNALFATAGTGTACDAHNRGDPVALYDAQADRFIVTDFAFTSTISGPFYECIAASKTGDPTGDWWTYALRADDASHKWLADYPKLGVWSDGIYMSANMFDCSLTCNGHYQGTRVWALNRANLYNGIALQSVFFDVMPSAIFSLLPSNLRGPMPPAGTPNYFVSNDQNVYGLDVFKFHVNFAVPGSSTFLGPTPVAVASYVNPPFTIPELSANPLDSLGSRLMMQNQYRNIGGVESLWVTHTADDTPTGLRWYQLNVTAGIVAPTPVQQSTYKPDADYRWMPSLAVDKFGDMAIGYSVANSGLHAGIRYAGRLAGDAANTLGQGETTLIAGTGGQTGNCGNVCTRWGDYSAMTVDPTDDCTFWYTTEYYAADGLDWQTRIGSFKFPACGTATYTYLPIIQNNPPTPPAWTKIMHEEFEGPWPSVGWIVSDFGANAYVWGKRNCRANTGSFSAWAMGGGSSGSGLGCGSNYINNAFSWAIFGPFSLADATAAQFNAQLWLNTEPGHDQACIMASTDNNQFYGNCLTGTSNNVFIPVSLDLSNVFTLGDLRGNPSVWVAVIFTSDASINLPEGASVDDLLLRKCTFVSCPALPSGQTPANSGQLQSHPASLTRPTNVKATGPAGH